MTRQISAILLVGLLAISAGNLSAFAGRTERPIPFGLSSPDSLVVESRIRGRDLIIDISRAGGGVIDLASLRLESPVNTRFLTIEPQPIAGTSAIRVVVIPIDNRLDASCQVVLKERDGMRTVVPYNYIASRIESDAPEWRRDFGRVAAGTTATTEIRFTNLAEKVTRVETIDLVHGNRGFTIVSMTPGPLPVELPKNATLTVTVAAVAEQAGKRYADSLIISYDCCWRQKLALNIDGVSGTSGIDLSAAASGPVVVRPHPVRGASSISFNLERPGRVRLLVTDPAGKTVTALEKEMASAGEQSILWDASSLPAGIYFYRLDASGTTASGSILVAR